MSQFQRALWVARRELRDSLTDWRILTPVSLLTFLFPWVVIYATKFGIGYAERYDPELVLTRLIPFSVMVVGFFPISFSLVIALESFVGEKERNTLESMLSTPITDGALYVGKLLAALALPLIASITAMFIYTFGLPRITGEYVPGSLLAQIILLTSTLALGMVAGAVVVSSNTTSVRAANLLASFIVLPSMFVVQLQAMVVLWEQMQVLWYIAAAMVLTDLALIRMGIRLFNREELLSRTLDRVDIRRAWRAFRDFFRQEPDAALSYGQSAAFSLRRLYRRDLPQLLRRNLGATVVVLLLILGAFGVGWLYAMALPLPEQFAESINLNGPELQMGWDELSQVIGLHPWRIFFLNLRNLFLASIGGMISFGTTSTIPLFTVSGLIGFAAGQGAQLGVNLGRLSSLLWPHGIFELPAAILATAGGLRMGAAILSPVKGFTLGETLLQGLADFIKLLLLLVIPLLLLAAFVEVYVTPQLAFRLLAGL